MSIKARKLQNTIWNEANQFFFMLVLVLLAGLANKTKPDSFLYLIGIGVGWVLLARLACLDASVNHTATFHDVRAMGCL